MNNLLETYITNTLITAVSQKQTITVVAKRIRDAAFSKNVGDADLMSSYLESMVHIQAVYGLAVNRFAIKVLNRLIK